MATLFDAGEEKTQFQFLPEIPIDIDETLYQLLRPFQTVKDGVPELTKNSKDHYSRRGVNNKSDRQIVVIVDTRRRNLAVLDFAGASKLDFEKWQTWSDPTASRADTGSDIEGGHGNGGKAFMVWGALTDSFLESSAEGRRTRMGYKNDERSKRHRPAYIREGGIAINNLKDTNPKVRLDALLKDLGASFSALPQDAKRVFEERDAFTLVRLNRVRDWDTRRQKKMSDVVDELVFVLTQHPQAALTLETCSVWILADGKLATPGALTPVYPTPMPGFENLEKLAVPARLIDPETGEAVETGADEDGTDFLQLRTSKRHLRQTDKALNVLRVRNARNVIAIWSVADLAPQNESAFIYGDARLHTITDEHLSGSDRKGLADTPLTRAVRQWVTEHVSDLASQLQRAIMKDHKQHDRDKANDSLSRFRNLMKKFLDLDPFQGDEDGDGRGPKGDGPEGIIDPPPPNLKGKVVHRIDLEPGRTSLAMATGTEIPLIARCYEIGPAGDLRPVPNVALELHTDSPAPLTLTNRLMLQAQEPWTGAVWVRDNTTGVESEKVQIESLACTGADLSGIDRLLLKGERVRLKVTFHAEWGPREDLLIEGFVDETDRARISRTAVLTAGRLEGDITVRVRFGPKPGDTATCTLKIGSESLPPRARGGDQGGSNIPYILLCGTEAPGVDDLPPEQRTHHGGEHYPTIIEEPTFDHVVWINPDSKESMRIRQGRGGTKGAAGIGTKTFTQFIAIKCFDILKRLRVRQDLGETAVTEVQFRNYLAMAEMECADFVDEAFGMADEIATAEPEKTT